ncbi:MAG: sugar phosphate isomerase/epimerase [Verrucomicrobia bacterium]|nr:sugar phosphate isomerase/epimerase [Verrucomicrobiota bacterium]
MKPPNHTNQEKAHFIPSTFSRREILTTLAGSLGYSLLSEETPTPCSLSIGTYGLQMLPLKTAIDLVSKTGYDGIEIAAMPGYPGDPNLLSSEKRKEIKTQRSNLGLRIDAIMAGIVPSEEPSKRTTNLDRLQQCFDFAQELSTGNHRPLVQTILGGKSDKKPSDAFIEEIGTWKDLALKNQTVLAIKPHRGHTISSPDQGIKLLRHLGPSPWLRLAFDYSHFAFRNLSIENTIKTSLPWTGYVVLKDAIIREGKIRFALPGATESWDQAEVIRRFYEGGNRGSFCCEISNHVWKQQNYNPITAIQTSYEAMADAFRRAGVPRI